MKEVGVCKRDIVVDKGEPEGEERLGLEDQVLLDLDLVLGEVLSEDVLIVIG